MTIFYLRVLVTCLRYDVKHANADDVLEEECQCPNSPWLLISTGIEFRIILKWIPQIHWNTYSLMYSAARHNSVLPVFKVLSKLRLTKLQQFPHLSMINMWWKTTGNHCFVISINNEMIINDAQTHSMSHTYTRTWRLRRYTNTSYVTHTHTYTKTGRHSLVCV